MQSHMDSPAPPWDLQDDEPVHETQLERMAWRPVRSPRLAASAGECGQCGAIDGDPCREDCRVRAVTSGPVCGGAA